MLFPGHFFFTVPSGQKKHSRGKLFRCEYPNETT